MKRPLLILLVLLVLVGAAVAVYLVTSTRLVMHEGNTASSTPNLTGQAIFTDGEHGFLIQYPESYKTDFTFKSFYHLPANWRTDSLPDVTGTPVVAFIGYRTESDHAYPRYYDAEVRIGASNDPKEVARCTELAANHGEVALPDVTLGGTVFKVFSFQSAGMMQYLKGVSYRAVHEGSCIAIEKLATGSNYQDDPDSPDDVPQATLDAAYVALDPIVSTFTFVSR